MLAEGEGTSCVVVGCVTLPCSTTVYAGAKGVSVWDNTGLCACCTSSEHTGTDTRDCGGGILPRGATQEM